ncbi:3-isopropylmalate dehydratase large subunit [Burkholderia sp. IDO3]|uniref:3-isopropylmalate dehydratase large subunit n=1 Tax=Burkholderia sp. IDO3 TaxID=1705310 RepID=UPI000BBB1A63|nr:3-isopropylmalate dehydratase large subunit [Burkholderia sp. IDO3]AXK61247.1 3-isopropylmalate dehydratase large subunit [Burkholderia sp. IDO3]PCD56996.1 3-isopropylmalate dehydratase large subunit [Burkholderia sp. IDO3]
MSRTLYQKLVDSHTVAKLDAEHVLLYADLHIMNEYTSPQAFNGLVERGVGVLRPGQQMGVVDHVIPTRPDPVGKRVIAIDAAARQAANFTRNCARYGIKLFDVNDPLQGIEHVVAPESGLIRPGMVVLCGDSHTTTYGAFGALGFGIGTSEIEHVLATQTLSYRVAHTMRIRIDGRLPAVSTAKDLVLCVIAKIGAQGARGYAVEYVGDAIRALSMEARMTLCNMTVEAGARAVLIEPDDITFAYLRAHRGNLDEARMEAAIDAWRTLRTDAGAGFDREIAIDASDVAPYVTWGTSPDQAIPVDGLIPAPQDGADRVASAATARALDYIGLAPGASIEGTPIDRVFIGSCTNGRIEDLRAAAAMLRDGMRVAPTVRAMIVPGSGTVRAQAEREGLSEIFIRAGFEWRQPGCSMCLAMNDDVLRPGERCASTTNRNFEGRQGRDSRTHLMSPAMAAAAAIAGRITDIRKWEHRDA